MRKNSQLANAQPQAALLVWMALRCRRAILMPVSVGHPRTVGCGARRARQQQLMLLEVDRRAASIRDDNPQGIDPVN